MVEGLPEEEDLAGLSAVEAVGVGHALVIEGLGKAVHGPGGGLLGRVVEGHVIVVQAVHLADAGAGIALGRLPGGIPVAVLQLPVLHQHGAEGEGEEDVVVEEILLHVGAAALLQTVGEVEVALGVDKAGVDAVIFLVLPGVGALVHAPELPLIDHGAEIAEHVEVRVHRDHGVDAARHLRGVEPDRGAQRVLRDLAPKLRGVGHLDLTAGAGAAVDDLLPEDHQDRLVVVIADEGVVIELHVRIEDQLLPVEQAGAARLLDDREELIGLVDREGAEAVRVRSRGGERVLRDHIVLADRRDAAERVGLGVGEAVR